MPINRPVYLEYFNYSVGYNDANKVRSEATRDIVKRLKFITRDNIRLTNYPVRRPVSAFNPSIVVEGSNVYIYARIILGYYLYISSIAEIRLDPDELLDKNMYFEKELDAKIVIQPDNPYDINGVEDPRTNKAGGEIYTTYSARTVNYYKRESGGPLYVVPLTAKRVNGYYWKKLYAYSFGDSLQGYIIDDRDAFIYEINGEYYLFHRPTMIDGRKYLVISKIDMNDARRREKNKYGITVLETHDHFLVLPEAEFEEKIGWATPPIRIGSDKVAVFIHGVDYEIKAYRMYAAEIRVNRREGIVVEAVTPNYIMEPKLEPEINGDRPYTIFPCGLWRLDKENYLISYGAGDFNVGIGMISIDELLSELDKGRIY